MCRKKNCTQKISREHHVSDSILRDIDSIIELNGFPWQGSEVKKIPVSKLGAKILCERHNNCLSPLDSEAYRFFQTMRGIASFTISDDFFLFSGKDIERWMLKVLYGLIASKSLQEERGKPITAQIDIKCLDLLFDKITWQNNQGLFIRADLNHTAIHCNSLSASPILNKSNQTIQGIHLNIRGFDFLLSTTPINAEDSIFRPKQIIFDKKGKQKIIEFSWDSPIYNKIAKFTWTGTTS